MTDDTIYVAESAGAPVPSLNVMVADLREAARGAGITITRTEVREHGLAVHYGSYDDRGDATTAASKVMEDGEASARWPVFGPRGFEAVRLQALGREQGRWGHVVPFADLAGLIAGLRSEWARRYRSEQSRWRRLKDRAWAVLSFSMLAVALVLAVAGAGATRADDTVAAAWLFGFALVFAYCAPTWDDIPDSTVPPAVAP